MAEAGINIVECDTQSLKQLLNDTATACQKCLVAVDSIVSNQRQVSVPSVHSTAVSSLLTVDLKLLRLRLLGSH